MHFGFLALYGGPDQVITVTSGIASIIGVLMVFWHKIVNWFFRVIGRKPSPQPNSQQDSKQSSAKSPSQVE